MSELMKHQIEGVDFLVKNNGGILADEMGLGKTAQAIVTCEKLGLKHILISTLNSIKYNWEDEVKLWSPDSSVVVVNGEPEPREKLLNSGARFTIVNYEVLGGNGVYDEDTGKRTKIVFRHLDTLLKQKYDGIIFDEAHKLKSRKAMIFDGAKKIRQSRKDIFQVSLSGTPLLNIPEELWPLLYMYNPREFSSYWRWVEQYCVTAQSPYSRFSKDILGVRDPEVLRNDLRKVLLRRTKSDVLDLPPKIFQDIPVQLTYSQRKAYNSVQDDMFLKLESGVEINTIGPLAQITRLRQICISPDLLDDYSNKLRGAKIDALRDIIDGSGDQKVVVFSQYARVINRLCSWENLPKWVPEKLHLTYFTGENDLEYRHECVKLFQEDPEIKCLFTTIGAGGTGINLTKGSIAVFLDLGWTPADNAQAADRLHRIGQENAVTVITLSARDTIEEHVQQILNSKQALFDAVIPEESVYQAAYRSLRRRS